MKKAVAKQDIQDDMEDFFWENGTEVMSAMTGIMSAQQNIAFNLTKLIVEQDKRKEEIFGIYREAYTLVKEQMEE